MSLIEVMVALGVMTITGIGAIALLSTSFSLSKDSRRRSEAASMARITLDTIIATVALSKDDTDISNNLAGLGYNVGGAATVTGPNASTDNFIVTVRISSETPAGSGNYPVRIGIAWERGKHAYSAPLNFQTIVGRP